jgi:hypothetical protein
VGSPGDDGFPRPDPVAAKTVVPIGGCVGLDTLSSFKDHSFALTELRGRRVYREGETTSWLVEDRLGGDESLGLDTATIHLEVDILNGRAAGVPD